MSAAVKPELVAFDLDGTLVGSTLAIRPRVLRAIERMRREGVRGCIVTGRMYRSALPFVRELGFEDPVVCYQGAAVFDPRDGSSLYERALPNEYALLLQAYAREHGLHIQLYCNDRYYCEEANAYAQMYARISGVEPIVVPSLREQFARWDATKACIIAEPDIVAQHLAGVEALLGGHAYVTRSIPWFLEVMDASVDKGNAIRFVADRIGIPMERAMAIGDSWNDAPLLRAVGYGVAMGSAPQPLREVADAIVADVEADGVAEALERFVLS